MASGMIVWNPLYGSSGTGSQCPRNPRIPRLPRSQSGRRQKEPPGLKDAPLHFPQSLSPAVERVTSVIIGPWPMALGSWLSCGGCGERRAHRMGTSWVAMPFLRLEGGCGEASRLASLCFLWPVGERWGYSSVTENQAVETRER